MNRPKFGLRLLLLIVALTAVTAAWRGIEADIRRAGQATDRINLESAIILRENELARIKRTKVASQVNSQLARTQTIQRMEAEIVQLRKKLTEFGSK